MATVQYWSFGLKDVFPGSGGGSAQRGTMTPVIGITAYDDTATWTNWQARASLLPYAYVGAVRHSGGPAGGVAPGGRGPARRRPAGAAASGRRRRRGPGHGGRPGRPGRVGRPGHRPGPVRPA